MDKHFLKKKQGKPTSKRDIKRDINEMLDFVVTLSDDADIIKLIAKPKTESEKELRYIISKLSTIGAVRDYVDYLRENGLSYSKETLKSFVIDSKIEDIETEGEAEDGMGMGGGGYKEDKRQRRSFDGSDSEDDFGDFDLGGEGTDSDTNDEEDDVFIQPPIRPIVSIPVDTKLQEERIMLNKIEQQQEKELERLHMNRKDADISEEDFAKLVKETIKKFENQQSLIYKSKKLPNSYREDYLTQLKDVKKLKPKEENELSQLKKYRERFEARLQTLRDNTVGEARVYGRILKSKMKIYRDADWMRTGDVVVKRIYINLSKYIDKQIGVENNKIKYNGDTWFLANNNFYELMATSNAVCQRKDILYISNLGKIVKVKILYQANNGSFVVQNENIFELMQNHLQMLKSPPDVQKDMRSEMKFALNNADARKVAIFKLSFPGGADVERKIAEQSVGNTISEYFRKIVNITAYLSNKELLNPADQHHPDIFGDVDSVFKQRLVMGWFSIDLTKLTVYDKIDYQELAGYYLNLIEFDLEGLKWEYFSMCGGKIVRLNRIDPIKPKLENENMNGNNINYPPNSGGKIYQVIGIDVSDKSTEFSEKIKKMDAYTNSGQRSYRKTLWDLVDDALDYAETHHGSIAKWKLKLMKE